MRELPYPCIIRLTSLQIYHVNKGAESRDGVRLAKPLSIGNLLVF